MSDSEQDDEFEAYLKRRTPIDKRTIPLEPLEPPPELDRIVIGKARKAIQGAPSLNMYHAPKWALPVGLAATILISFAVLLDLGVRAKRNDASLQAALSQGSAPGHSQSPVKPEPTLVSQSSEIRPAEPGSSAGARAAAQTRSAVETRAEAEPRAAAETSSGAPAVFAQSTSPSSVMPPPPAPVMPGSAASNTAAPATAAEEEFSSDRARTRLARAEKAAKRARPEPEAMTGSSATLAEAVVVGERRTADAPSVPAAAIAAAPVDAPPIAPVPNEVEAPSPSPAAQAASASGAEEATSVARESAKRENPDPAAWLMRIEKLRSAGHTAAAEREMTRFRKTYPDYPLPKADR